MYTAKIYEMQTYISHLSSKFYKIISYSKKKKIYF